MAAAAAACALVIISCCLPLGRCQRQPHNYRRFPTLEGNLQSDTPDALQAAAARDLLSRLVPAAVTRKVGIVVSRGMRLPGGRDVARLSAADGADFLAVHASSGVAAAWGLHHYLKYWCGSHVSWDHRQLSVPTPLPAVNHTLQANDAVRYYENVCEYGYRDGK